MTTMTMTTTTTTTMSTHKIRQIQQQQQQRRMRRRLSLLIVLLMTITLLDQPFGVMGVGVDHQNTSTNDEDNDENCDPTGVGSGSGVGNGPKDIDDRRLWGSQKSDGLDSDVASPSGTSNTGAVPTSSSTTASSSSTTTTTTATTNNHPAAFVAKTATTAGGIIPQQYVPPEGFRIKTRVYTDPDDKLAHFDDDFGIDLPFQDCGVSGSTTMPIPLQHATVRHLLGGSKPNLYSGEEFGPHPQFVIALTPVEVILNSGQVQVFQPGDVILLEDVLSGGHKLKGYDKQDMTVMILTLPQHYHHVGKDKSSLKHLFGTNTDKSRNGNKMKNPCPNKIHLDYQNNKNYAMNYNIDDDDDDMDSIYRRSGGAAAMNLRDGGRLDQLLQHVVQPFSVRRVVLTGTGLAMSTFLGNFLAKVIPVGATVLFAVGCFGIGATSAFVQTSEYCINEFETWQERRQLQLGTTKSTTTTTTSTNGSEGEGEEGQDGREGNENQDGANTNEEQEEKLETIQPGDYILVAH